MRAIVRHPRLALPRQILRRAYTLTAPSWPRLSRANRPVKVFGSTATSSTRRYAFPAAARGPFIPQIAGLANIASNYLIAGQEASRHGTAHPSVVPYQVFPCRDGFLMIGAGNDKQFRILCDKVLSKPALALDPRFVTNEARVAHRAELVRIIEDALMQHDRAHWLESFMGLGYIQGVSNVGN